MFKKFIKNTVFIAVSVVVISVVLDFIRAPQSLNVENYTTLNQKAQSKGLTFEKDKLYIVYIWAEWCGICSVVSPKIDELQKEGYPVISIAMTSGTDDEVQNYLKEKNYSFSAINDPYGKLSNLLDVHATPTILFIKNGEIKHSMVGLKLKADIELRYNLLN